MWGVGGVWRARLGLARKQDGGSNNGSVTIILVRRKFKSGGTKIASKNGPPRTILSEITLGRAWLNACNLTLGRAWQLDLLDQLDIFFWSGILAQWVSSGL